jgi:hypothetical protein
MKILSILELPYGFLGGELLILALLFLPTLIAVISIVINKFEQNQQLLWLLIAIFAPFGAYIYFFVGYRKRIR